MSAHPSIRRRLVVGLALALSSLLTLVGCALYGAIESRVATDFDDALARSARQLTALVENEAGTLEFDYVQRFHPEFERADAPDCFELFLDDGSILMASTGLGENEDLVDEIVLDPLPTWEDHTLRSGRTLRVVQFAFDPKVSTEDPEEGAEWATTPPMRLVVAVGRDRAELDALLAGVRNTVAAALAAAVALTLLAVLLLVDRGLRPLRRLAQRVAALSPDNLQTIPVDKTPEELRPVGERLNAFVVQLREAMARERRFAGNVAHELRTPVAELRTLASVACAWPRDGESVRGFFGDVSSIADHMERVIRDLLLLARCHSGSEPLHASRTSPRSVAERSWKRLASRALADRTSLVLSGDAVCTRTDADKFAILCENLLGNAIAHSPPGSTVSCRATRDGDRFRLRVSNPARPMSREELDRLAEPFWRPEGASADSEHAGLGLALVQAIADLLRLTVRLSQTADGLFHATITGAALADAEDALPAEPTPSPLRTHSPSPVEQLRS